MFSVFRNGRLSVLLCSRKQYFVQKIAFTVLLCTKTDLITIQGKVEKFDIVEQCTEERQNTKWRFKLITNVTIFAALLKKIPMGCPDSVLPEPLLRHTQVYCLLSDKDKQPYKDHLCLFRALTTLTFTILILELARQSIGKFEKTVKSLRFNNHIIHTNDIDSFFKCLRCPTSDCFFNRSNNFNRHLMTFKDRVRHNYPKNVYTLRETLNKKLDGFNIPVSKDNTLFNILAIFDFESICVPSDELKATKTSTWVKKTRSNFCIIILEPNR